jgi:hypothetical protein
MTQPISPLRHRMIDDMTMRNLSANTQETYIRSVAQFSAFHRRSPDKLGVKHVRDFHLHLVSRGVMANSIAVKRGHARLRRGPGPPSGQGILWPSHPQGAGGGARSSAAAAVIIVEGPMTDRVSAFLRRPGAGRPAAPEEMTPREREIWTDAVQSRPLHYFDAPTWPLLTAYCMHARRSRAQAAAVGGGVARQYAPLE